MESNLPFAEILSTAWSRVPGLKKPYMLGFLINIVLNGVFLFVIGFVVGFLMQIIVGDVPHDAEGHIVFSAFTHGQFVSLMCIRLVEFVLSLAEKIFIAWPMIAGLMLIALHHAAGKRAYTGYVFRAITQRMIWPIAGLFVLIGLFLMIPFLVVVVFVTMAVVLKTNYIVLTVVFAILAALVVCWIIYLAISYSMSLLLLLDRRSHVGEAMRLSRKGVTKHWFKVFFIFIVATLCIYVPMIVATVLPIVTTPWLLIATIPLYIVLMIWVMPWVVMVFLSIYERLFGIEGKDVISDRLATS